MLTLWIFPATVNCSYLNIFSANPNVAQPESWYIVTQIFTFNVMEFVGAWCGNKPMFTIKSIAVIKNCAWLRILFVATFLLTDFQATPLWLWDTDAFKIIDLILLAWTCGYVGTLAAKKIPTIVEPAKRTMVCAYIGTCIAIGILFGTFL
jgi:hypothetical protein